MVLANTGGDIAVLEPGGIGHSFCVTRKLRGGQTVNRVSIIAEVIRLLQAERTVSGSKRLFS